MIETTDTTVNTLAPVIFELPAPLKPLGTLAWNYWWSWSADGPSIFRDLDPELWEECEHNPRLLLARTSEYRLAQMATDPVYIERVRCLADLFEQYMAPAESWRSETAGNQITRERPVAYFCAEYGVQFAATLFGRVGYSRW